MESAVSTECSKDQVTRMDSTRTPFFSRCHGVPSPTSRPTHRWAAITRLAWVKNMGRKRSTMEKMRARAGKPLPKRYTTLSSVITSCQVAHHKMTTPIIPPVHTPYTTDSRVTGFPEGRYPRMVRPWWEKRGLITAESTTTGRASRHTRTSPLPPRRRRR